MSAEDQPSVGEETPPLDVIVARLAAGLGTLTAIAETFADADPLDTSEADRTALWRASRLVDEAITVIDYPGDARKQLRTFAEQNDRGRSRLRVRSDPSAVHASASPSPCSRYDLKLWVGHLLEGAAYLPR